MKWFKEQAEKSQGVLKNAQEELEKSTDAIERARTVEGKIEEVLDGINDFSEDGLSIELGNNGELYIPGVEGSFSDVNDPKLAEAVLKELENNPAIDSEGERMTTDILAKIIEK